MWVRGMGRWAASLQGVSRASTPVRRVHCCRPCRTAAEGTGVQKVRRRVDVGAGAGAGHHSEEPTVRVAQGLLRGRLATAKYGGPYYSFQGVPYAEPPLGELRFEPPQPPESWSGVRDALNEEAVCSQLDWIWNRGFIGQEDCLFLNIYTSELPSGSETIKKPVMVWIHGGRFSAGSGNTDLYGPDYLVESGAVLVTMNYRLGVLGFLSLEDESFPGNMGMKDQVAALQWVQKNIDQFGGDPDNVTLFGQSAGGASVQMHLLSPMSKGLFHKAISQSGSIFNQWAIIQPHSLKPRAFRLGEVLGYKTTDPKKLIEFLRKVPPRDLIESSSKTISKLDRRRGDVSAFIPNIEKEIPGNECFLPGHPENLLSNGKFNDVPYLSGVTSHEGTLHLRGMVKQPRLLVLLGKDFERLVPKDLSESRDKSKRIAGYMKRFYFDKKQVSISTIRELSNVFTDNYYVYGMYKTIQHLSRKSKSPLYYYRFSYQGELGISNQFSNAPSSLSGANHMDDIGYLFRAELFDVDVNSDSQERSMIRKMVKMWTNFASTGNPTSELDDEVNIQWLPYTSANPVFLSIDEELTMERNMLKERMAFWDTIYKAFKL